MVRGMPERPGRGVPVTVTCNSCGVTSLHHAHHVYVITRAQLESSGRPWPEPWDGLYVEPILTCPFCRTDDDYGVSSDELTRLFLHPTSRAGEAYELPDGGVARRPSEAVVWLHARARANLNDAAAWRELGNYCFRVGLERVALDHWLHAHRIDRKEVHAGASLAWVAHMFGFSHVSGALAAEVLERHHHARRALSPTTIERLEQICRQGPPRTAQGTRAGARVRRKRARRSVNLAAHRRRVT